jgi:hypothetical protein
MIPKRQRAAVLLALVAVGALSACRRDEDAALTQDSSLMRDLAGADTAAQPQLKDVPAVEAPAPAQPATKSPPRAPSRPKTSAPAPSAPAPSPPAAPAPAESKGEVGRTGTIAGGTTLALSSTEKVCTNTNKVGDRFTATVNEPVTGTNGATIPAGSRVTIELTTLHRSENANDRIVMGFRVVSVTVDGKTYYPDAEVVTASVDRIRSTTTGDAAKKVAVGAAIGAVLGQVIGRDRKGTLIGAAAGAAAGGAAAAATADHDGCVNSGAPITVRITQPMTITVV